MPSQQQMDNLRAVVPFAQATQRRWHVPASVTLAQWITESGWGLDGIAVKANNCFGIKHAQKNYTEPYVQFQTTEFAPGASKPHVELAAFVKYDSVADSFESHGRLLEGTTRYNAALGVLPDVPAYARAIQRAGYSTAPTYAVNLCKLIDLYHLQQYDQFPADTLPARKTA